MTWWTEDQLATLATRLDPSCLEYIRGMSIDNIISSLRAIAMNAVSPMDAKLATLHASIQSDIQSVRNGVLTDLVTTLGNPTLGGIERIQTLIGGIDQTAKSLLEHTQKLPEAIELHKTRPKVAAKIGQIGEAYVADILKSKYSDVTMTTGKTASGDIRVNKRLMVEIKMYKTPVPLKEYDKFVRDIVFCKEVTCAMFVTNTALSSPDYKTPLHYMVKRVDSNRVIPVAIVTGAESQLILNTSELLLTHSEILDSISSTGEVNKTAKSEISQLIFDATADLKDIVSTRETLMELSLTVTKSIQRASADLCELERKFHLKLVHMRNKLNDILDSDARNTVNFPICDDSTIDTMLNGCRKSKSEAQRILREAIRRAAPFNPPPIGPIGYTSKYVSMGTFSLHFTVSNTTFRLPAVSMSRSQKYELMELFTTRDHSVTPDHIEITLDESSVDDIIRHCFKYCGV